MNGSAVDQKLCSWQVKEEIHLQNYTVQTHTSLFFAYNITLIFFVYMYFNSVEM